MQLLVLYLIFIAAFDLRKLFSVFAYKVSSASDNATMTMELKPGQLIRPAMDCDKAVELVESLYGFTVLEVRQLDSYDDRNFHVRVSLEKHRNPHVEGVSPHGYVLKVMNSIDSHRPHVGK